MYSDVTLFLGELQVKFHAHYVILSTRTNWFDAARRAGFKESEDNVFCLTEFSFPALLYMLDFITSGDYTALRQTFDSWDEDELYHDVKDVSSCKDGLDPATPTFGPYRVMDLLREISMAADFFGIEELSQKCESDMSKNAQIFATGFSNKNAGGCQESYATVLERIYEMPDAMNSSFRQALMRVITKGLKRFHDSKTFHEIKDRVPGFAKDLLSSLIEREIARAMKPTRVDRNVYRNI